MPDQVIKNVNPVVASQKSNIRHRSTFVRRIGSDGHDGQARSHNPAQDRAAVEASGIRPKHLAQNQMLPARVLRQLARRRR